jgi:hypothetical protein
VREGEPEKQFLGRVPVSDVRGRDHHHQHETAMVADQVPFAAVDLLPGVVPSRVLADRLGCLHRLGVHDHRGCAGCLASGETDAAPELVADDIDDPATAQRRAKP